MPRTAIRLALAAAALGSVMAAGGCARSASGDGGLRYVFQTRTYPYHASAEIKGEIQAQAPGSPGMAQIPIDGGISYDLNLRVKPSGAGGEVEQEIANGFARVDMGGQLASQPIPEAMVTLEMDPTGKVRGEAGVDSLVLDAQFLNARHFREMMAQVLAEYPAGRALRPGDRWKTEVSLAVPGGSDPVTAVIESEFKGIERKGGMRAARLEHRAEIPVRMTRRAQGATFSIDGRDVVETVSYVELRTGFPIAAETTIDYQADQEVSDGTNTMAMKMNLKTKVKLERAE